MHPNEIEAGRYYSVRAVAAMKILPWRSASTLAKAMQEDKWREVFQPVFDQKKNAMRVHIKGQSILDFIEKAKTGELSK